MTTFVQRPPGSGAAIPRIQAQKPQLATSLVESAQVAAGPHGGSASDRP